MKSIVLAAFAAASAALFGDAISPLIPGTGFLYSDGIGNVTATANLPAGNLITTSGVSTVSGSAVRTVHADLTVVDKSVVPFSVITNEVHGTVELPRSFSVKSYLWYWHGVPYDPYDEENLLGEATYTIGSGTSFPYTYTLDEETSYVPLTIEYTGTDTWKSTYNSYLSENTRTTNAVVSTVRTSGFEIACGGNNSSGNLIQFRCVVTMTNGSSGKMVDDSTQQYVQVVTNGFPTVVDRLARKSELGFYDAALGTTWTNAVHNGRLYLISNQ